MPVPRADEDKDVIDLSDLEESATDDPRAEPRTQFSMPSSGSITLPFGSEEVSFTPVKVITLGKPAAEVSSA